MVWKGQCKACVNQEAVKVYIQSANGIEVYNVTSSYCWTDILGRQMALGVENHLEHGGKRSDDLWSETSFLLQYSFHLISF